MIKNKLSAYNKNSITVASSSYNLRNRKIPKATNKEVTIYILRNRTITKIIPERVVPVRSKSKKFRCINLSEILIKGIGKNESSENVNINVSTNTICIESDASNKKEESKDCISVISVVDDSDDGMTCNSLVTIESRCVLSKKDQHMTLGCVGRRFKTSRGLNKTHLESNGDIVNEYSPIHDDDEGLDFSKCGYF